MGSIARDPFVEGEADDDAEMVPGSGTGVSASENTVSSTDVVIDIDRSVFGWFCNAAQARVDRRSLAFI